MFSRYLFFVSKKPCIWLIKYTLYITYKIYTFIILYDVLSKNNIRNHEYKNIEFFSTRSKWGSTSNLNTFFSRTYILFQTFVESHADDDRRKKWTAKKKNEKKKHQRMWTLQAEPVVLFVLFCFFFFEPRPLTLFLFFFCLFKVRECLYAWETLKNSTVDGIIIIIVIKKIK